MQNLSEDYSSGREMQSFEYVGIGVKLGVVWQKPKFTTCPGYLILLQRSGVSGFFTTELCAFPLVDIYRCIYLLRDSFLVSVCRVSYSERAIGSQVALPVSKKSLASYLLTFYLSFSFPRLCRNHGHEIMIRHSLEKKKTIHFSTCGGITGNFLKVERVSADAIVNSCQLIASMEK